MNSSLVDSIYNILIQQIIQEMELILKREKGSLLLHFQHEWQTKWVPVIVKFSQTYSKKSLAAITFDDDYSME